MNILFLADVFFPDTIGGAGRVAYYMGLEISKKEHTVHIITRNPGNKFDPYQRVNEYFHIYRHSTPLHESIKLLLLEIQNSYNLSRQLGSKAFFDLICFHQCLAAIGPYLTGAFRNIPSIYIYHSPWHQEYLIKKEISKITPIVSLMKWTENWILSRCNLGLVLSNYMLNNLCKSHPRNNTPISILPGGVDLVHFKLPPGGKDSLKNQLEIPSNKKTFLTIRNLVPRMGIENLIEAFNHSSVLKNNSILLIGGEGILGNKLRTMVKFFKLQETVKFLGHVPDGKLPKYYQAADFFVLPTADLEGFGLVILEALSCGTAVLGTPVGAIPEVLNRFDKRLIFSGTTWRDIKEKLEQVIEHPDLFHFAPERCREFVEKNYSWKKMADAFEMEALRLIHR